MSRTEAVPYAELPYELRAEYRAIERGTRVRVEDDGSISVRSESHPGWWRNVTFSAMVDGSIRFRCEGTFTDTGYRTEGCEGGTYGRKYDARVPCVHAAKAGRYLEHKHEARWMNGVFWVAGNMRRAWESATLAADTDQPEDVFKGLPR